MDEITSKKYNNLTENLLDKSPIDKMSTTNPNKRQKESKLEDFHLKRIDSNKHIEIHEEHKKLYLKENKVEKTDFENFTDNIKSGITVGLVNLPLSISLAVASGSTPPAGILSGIVGGMITGFLGGSNYNIVGPTGALSGFLMATVVKYGLSSIPIFSIISGILTLIVRHYHLENFIDLLPMSVNQGFTVGVALIIFFNQMNSALGIGKFSDVKNSGLISGELNQALSQKILNLIDSENNQSLIHNIIQNIKHINQIKYESIIIFLIFFTSFLTLIKKFGKIPWMIIMSIVGIFFGIKLEGSVDTLQSKFGTLSFQLYDFSYLHNFTYFIDPRSWIDCMPIAFVAVLETLISAKIADSMTNSKFNKKSELLSLGVSNTLCGILGGIPVTAALARTALNIKSGCTHRYSSLISSIFMFILSYFCLNYFSYVPMPVISAQVCIVAVRMVETEEIEHLYHKDLQNFYLFIVIVIISITRDTMEAVIFGMLIYQILFCKELASPWSELIKSSKKAYLTPILPEIQKGDNQYFEEENQNSPKNYVQKILYDNFRDNCSEKFEESKKAEFSSKDYMNEFSFNFNKNHLKENCENNNNKNSLYYIKNHGGSSGDIALHNTHVEHIHKEYNLSSRIINEKLTKSFDTEKLFIAKKENACLNDHHFYDIPQIEGDYIIYRIIGILNFMNVDFHLENIHSLNLDPKSKIIISMRYVHLIDSDAINSIKKIVKSFVYSNDNKFNEKDCKIMLSGLTRSKINLIKDDEFIKDMYEHGAIIFTPDQYLLHEIKHDFLNVEN